MITIALFQNDVKVEFWEADEAARVIEAEIEHMLDLVSCDLISIQGAVERLNGLYTELRQVSTGPKWDDFIPIDGAVKPPEVADDGYQVYVWPTMYQEVS